MKKISKIEAVLGLLFSVLLLSMLAIACVPSYYLKVVPSKEMEREFVKVPIPPVQPDFQMATLESVVNTSPIINGFERSMIVTPRSTIGVMDFKAAMSGGSGTLVADTFSIAFLNRGVNVVERQNIRKITEEQIMAAEGMQSISDEEIAKRIGKLTRADFILFGAVTQYHFENRKLPIPYIVPPDELNRYLADIRVYKQAARSFEAQESKNDELFFKYVEDDLFTQLQLSDVASLNRMQIEGYNRWKHKSASNIDWGYPYFKSRKVLPSIGERIKDLTYKQQRLQQEIAAWNDSFVKYLEKRDEAIAHTELFKMFQSYNKYNRSVEKREKEMKKAKPPKKYTEIHDDENIQRARKFCKNTAARLREFFELIKKQRALELRPIPERLGQFEAPKDRESFVSVANMGITFKIIDVRTGEIVWIGQASKRDLNIQKGLNNMVQAVVTEIIG